LNLNTVITFHKIRINLMVLSGCALASLPVSAQTHAHIYAGALCETPYNPLPGEPLWFVNSDVWDTNSYGGYTQSPACIYLEASLPNLYPGLFQTATTFSALPATVFNAGPSPYAASLGTYMELKFISLQGPSGGSLVVWNEIDDPAHPAVMFTLPTGTTDGTNRYNLSEGDPLDASADPYGHIHGRRFTVDKPGLYILGLQVLDAAHNGPEGGPIHTPSTTNYFYLQAGLYLSDFSRCNNTVSARFGLAGSTNYVFEASPTNTGTNWATIANITGTAHSELRWVTDTNATGTSRFYRVRKGTN